MRITSKGQVTIPQAIRDAHGLLPQTEVDFVLVDGAVTLVRADPDSAVRAENALASLEGNARPGVTTDELLALMRE